jgi:flavin-binding protein dodecin
MSNTYKMVTVVGTSPDSFEAAIANALSDATATVRNLSWFEVQEQRGRIVDGKVAEYQIKLQIGFRVEVP